MRPELIEVTRLVSQLSGRDVSVYDETFLIKAIEKRLSATTRTSLVEYCVMLTDEPEELETFCDSLIITYSEFFRNPLAFALLEEMILPHLLQKTTKAGRSEIRVWSAGCAAGQEAYSIAILLNDLLESNGGKVSFRVFASDQSTVNLELAQKGVYDSLAVQNVRLKQVHEYFIQEGALYIVRKEIRDRIDFSAYDLLDEHSVCPPASIYGDFDLIFCSNLLFYYRPDVRQFILKKMYHALSPGGYLVTGESERGFVESSDGFVAVAPPVPVFQKK